MKNDTVISFINFYNWSFISMHYKHCNGSMGIKTSHNSPEKPVTGLCITVLQDSSEGDMALGSIPKPTHTFKSFYRGFSGCCFDLWLSGKISYGLWNWSQLINMQFFRVSGTSYFLNLCYRIFPFRHTRLYNPSPNSWLPQSPMLGSISKL